MTLRLFQVTPLNRRRLHCRARPAAAAATLHLLWLLQQSQLPAVLKNFRRQTSQSALLARGRALSQLQLKTSSLYKASSLQKRVLSRSEATHQGPCISSLTAPFYGHLVLRKKNRLLTTMMLIHSTLMRSPRREDRAAAHYTQITADIFALFPIIGIVRLRIHLSIRWNSTAAILSCI